MFVYNNMSRLSNDTVKLMGFYVEKELIIMNKIVRKNVKPMFTWGSINNTYVCIRKEIITTMMRV